MTAPSGQPSVYEPSQDERTLACISHLSIFVSSIGLLIAIGLWIYLQRRYPYAAFQAGQAVIFQFIVMILTFITVGIIMLIIFGAIGVNLAVSGGTGGSEGAFVAFIIIATLVSVTIIGILTVALYGYAIYAAVRAYQGRPFRIPLISMIAESISPMPNVVTREQ